MPQLPVEPAKAVSEILSRYHGDPARMIEILQDLQEIYRYLPKEVIEEVSHQTEIPINRIYHIATFYKAFHLEPRGETIITVCTGTACHVRGSFRTLDLLSERLGVKPNETSGDLKYTLETVGCVGACALGPIVIINGKYYGHMTPDRMDRVLKRMGIIEKYS